MALEAPNLDDLTYDDIVAQAKTLIPRYNPEWTNFNESDPGITLLGLFAWMTDMLVYRLNQVPERNYIKFLQLLGIQVNPAAPASVDLTFKLASTPGLYSVSVPPGTQVAASVSGSNGPLIFETNAELTALGATLAAVQSFDGFSYSIQTNKNNQTGQWFYPFGPQAIAGSALLLGFDSPNDAFMPSTVAQLQVNLTVYISSGNLKPQPQSCDMTAIPLQGTVAWECWDGQRWASLVLQRDETQAFTQNGHIYVQVPGNTMQKATVGLVTNKPLFWIRARLVAGSYEKTPRLGVVLINTVGTLQAVTVNNEVMGASDGSPNQTFTLAQNPVVVLATPFTVTRTDNQKVTPVTVTSLWLVVDESGSGNFQPWQEVSDFYGSGPDDPHYALDRTTGIVSFGDGQHGRIPPGTTSTSGIVAFQYKYGGGKAGNAGANTVTQLQTSIDGIESVTNQQPAFGGSDEESLDDAKARAPHALKSNDRAVTAEDFEYMAVQTPGANVRRAKALPLTHPLFADQPIPGVVTVIVIPDSDALNPMPSQGTLAVVCAYLNKHRLLTTEVYIIPPTYRKVRIQAAVIVLPQADLSEVQKSIVDSLTQYFHPLTGGDDQQGWPFGQTIYFSKIYRIVLDLPGVDRFQDQPVIYLDDERQPFCQDVPIGPRELLYSDQHDIQIGYGF
jgi:predicted phage baseplate assembly protein